MGAAPTQPLCTIRDLDELGIAPEALAMVVVRHRRNAIRATSGIVAGHVRKRNGPPLAPSIVDLDTSGLTLGASATLAGNPLQVADVVVQIAAGGTVGQAGITYKVSRDAGASLPTVIGGPPVSTFGAALPLALDGR